MEKFYQTGLINESNSDWEEAIKNYNNCLNAEPNHIQARIHLGQIYIQINNPDAALFEIEKALELSPDEEEARAALAWIYLLKNNMDSAEKTFAEALKKNPGNLKANLGMSWICLRNNDPVNAENYFKKYDALGAEKPHLNAYLEFIGKHFFDRGKYDLAEFWYTKLVRLEPNNFNYLRRLVMSCFLQKKTEKVLIELKKIKNFDLKAVNVNLEALVKSLEYYCGERYDAAIDVLKNMPDKNSEELPELYLLLGKCYLAKGDSMRAMEEFSKSLRALPDFIHSRIAMEEISSKI